MFNEGIAGGQLFITILVIVALISATTWIIIKARKNKKSKQSLLKQQMDLLKEKYARGEIDEEEFKERQIELMSPPTPR